MGMGFLFLLKKWYGTEFSTLFSYKLSETHLNLLIFLVGITTFLSLEQKQFIAYPGCNHPQEYESTYI